MTLINDVKSVMQTDMGIARAVHDLYLCRSISGRYGLKEHTTTPEPSLIEQDVRFASEVFARNNFYNVSIKLANKLNDDDSVRQFRERALNYHLNDPDGRIGNAANYAEAIGNMDLAAQLTARSLEACASSLGRGPISDGRTDLANLEIRIDRYRERFPDAFSLEEFEDFRRGLFKKSIDSYAQRNDFAWAAKIATRNLQDEELATELYGKDAEKTLRKLRAELAQIRGDYQNAYEQYVELGCTEEEAQHALDRNDPVMQYNHFFRNGRLDIALREAKKAERPDLVQEVIEQYGIRIDDFVSGTDYRPEEHFESPYILSLAETDYPDRLPEAKQMARIRAEGLGQWQDLSEGIVSYVDPGYQKHRFRIFDPSPEEEKGFRNLVENTGFSQLWPF